MALHVDRVEMSGDGVCFTGACRFDWRNVRKLDLGRRGEGERLLRVIGGHVDHDDGPWIQITEEQLLRQRVLDIALNRATQRTSTE